MEWWIWILIGLALCFAEVAFTPGVFVLLFFGVSSLVVGAIVGAGLGGPFWVQVAIFAAVGLGFLAIFRGKAKKLLGVKGGQMDLDSVVGCTAIARGEIQIGATGKVEFRGSSWNAVNIGSGALYPGDECHIQERKGLQLSVKGGRA